MLCDTAYRYICLFGSSSLSGGSLSLEQAAGGLSAAEAPPVSASAASAAIRRWLSSAGGKARFVKDHAQWSVFHGRAKPLLEGQRRMAQLPGAAALLRGLASFEPSRRWTVEQALESDFFGPLRVAGAGADGDSAPVFTA